MRSLEHVLCSRPVWGDQSRLLGSGIELSDFSQGAALVTITGPFSRPSVVKHLVSLVSGYATVSVVSMASANPGKMKVVDWNEKERRDTVSYVGTGDIRLGRRAFFLLC